jgi:hypothetical protein
MDWKLIIVVIIAIIIGGFMGEKFLKKNKKK